jgi:hypothetical protein
LDILLCALPAQGPVEKAVIGIQERLFSEWKLASGLCLPVLIPLLAAPMPSSAALSALNRDLGPSFKGETSGYGILEGVLYLAVTPEERLQEIHESMKRRLGPIQDRLLPACPGFFISRLEPALATPPAADKILASLPPAPRCRFSGEAVSLMRLTPLERDLPYWEAGTWAELLNIPLRGAAAPVPPPSPERS